MLSTEECALSTGQRSSDAAVKDVQKWLIQEVCALGTVPRKEECVEDTGQRSNYAAVKDAKT